MKDSVLEKSNILFLERVGIPFATVRLSENILKHSIFDANMEIRSFLRNNDLHDYEQQGLGSEHKVFQKTYILTFKRSLETNTSLYRSHTRGDCRMWFGSIVNKLSEPDNLFMITAIDKILYAINISKIDLELCYRSSMPNPISHLVKMFKSV